jgi:hypothetical protein
MAPTRGVPPPRPLRGSTNAITILAKTLRKRTRGATAPPPPSPKQPPPATKIERPGGKLWYDAHIEEMRPRQEGDTQEDRYMELDRNTWRQFVETAFNEGHTNLYDWGQSRSKAVMDEMAPAIPICATPDCHAAAAQYSTPRYGDPRYTRHCPKHEALRRLTTPDTPTRRGKRT